MTDLDDLLARGRLCTQPYTQDDIDAGAARLTARLERNSGAAVGPPPPEPGPAEKAAARDLDTLCETVLTHTGLRPLLEGVTWALPEAPGARVLGCVLHLAATEESARFWWQYAAGAGDPAAAYCLYLHHLALGEHGPARWWHTQSRRTLTPAPARPEPKFRPVIQISVPSCVTAALEDATITEARLPPLALRILHGLRRGTPTPTRHAEEAVLDYVPAAVGPVDDDLDLPLPDPDFTHRIRTLITHSQPHGPTLR
ncbi:hypothetical protein ACIQVO_36935 [Streptomyces sp. NPDC101062]|uniref:hypothetical protein n=1 Tax=unclassified Streptomyces TaxID=2593676 RepID=UPI00380EC791